MRYAHAVVVVAADDRVAGRPHARDDAGGVRAVADEVAEAVALGQAGGRDVGKHRVERGRVAVDVAVEREPPHTSHSSPSSSLTMHAPSISSAASRSSTPVGAGSSAKYCVAERERDVHQADEHRHLDERADDGGEGLAAVDAEDRDAHRDGELEVVRAGGEGERRGLGVAQADGLGDEERHEEHDREVGEHRAARPCTTSSGIWTMRSPLSENIMKIVKSSATSVTGPISRHEHRLVPDLALERDEAEARDDAGDERDAEVDQHRHGDLADGDVDDGAGTPKSGGSTVTKNHA